MSEARKSVNTLITGGAGFIGSHFVDTLLRKDRVHIFDNLTAGDLQNIKQSRSHPNVTFIKGDLLNPTDLKKIEKTSFETIFHLAANPEVRIGSTNPQTHFQQNVVATYNLLELIRKTQNKPMLVFTSTSTVYGEPTEIPTPEDYAPMKPISTYGASKLACEALISAYAHTYDFEAIIYRLANTVGPRNQHGIVSDFIQKLSRNPKQLEILGDGTQNKSYIYITDCVKAMLLGLDKARDEVEIYNIGSEDQVDVITISQIVSEKMGLKNVKLKLTGGVDGGRGWKGDVKNMLLDVNKLKSLGWKPRFNSKQAIAKATENIVAELQTV